MSPFRGRPGAAAGPGRFGGRSTLLQGDTAPVVSSVAASNGRTAGGLAVTIIGANFVYTSDGSAPLVTFDSIPATSVIIVDANTITCVTPAVPDTGTVDVAVTIGTQTGMLVGGFTYFTGTIVALSPNYGSIAGATTILISGYNFVTGSTITFGGSAGTNVIFIDTEHFKVTTPNHALGFVDVVITEPGGAQVTLRNGFQFTLLTRGNDIRRQPGITVRDSLSNPNTCSFVIDGNSNAPQIGEKIQIVDTFDGNRLLFSGSVITIDLDYGDGSGDGETDQLFWTVTCQDPTWGLNKLRPFGVYRNISASLVVKDLMARYTSGYTTAHVQSNLAKVSFIFDGTQDLFTCLKNIAKAIGGGHVKVDYTNDLHFFHVVPASLAPPVSQFAIDTTHLTVAEAGAIPAVFSYDQGFYFFRHSFLYSDGSESSLGAISNVLQVTGTNILAFTGIPIGVAKGTLTCVGRRIYVNRLTSPVAGIFTEIQAVENIRQFVQINDNATVNFSTWYGTTGADSAAVIAIPSSAPIPVKSFNGHPAAPTSAPAATANIVTSPGVVGSAATAGTFWEATWTQFKVAFLYRDGSVSLASPASNSAGLQFSIRGSAVAGYNLTGVPIGPTVNGVDVVARFVYFCNGVSANPNFSLRSSTDFPIGFVWPIPFNDPIWTADGGGQVLVLNDNVTQALSNFALGALGSGIAFSATQTPLLVGNSNFPYGNSGVLSTDPIPIWPNPDGPILEDVDPPADVTNTNPDLLRDPPFRVSADISQARNRVYVVGSGSIAALTAAVGATSILVGDISNFSPSGGKVRIVDTGTGAHTIIGYSGLAGVPGTASISLSSALTITVSQGSLINNFFQADDFDSQKFFSKIELDVNGNPTDGVHEFTIVDASLKATFQLYMRAYAELELWSKPIVSITYGTRDSKHKAGQSVHVDMDDPPCQGDFLIQDVTIDQIHDESDNLFPRYNVSASSVRFELDDLLLQILGSEQSGSFDGGVSSAGLVQSAVSVIQGTPATLSFVPRLPTPRIYNTTYVSGSNSLVTVGTGLTAASGAAVTSVDDATAMWLRYTGTGALIGVSSGGNFTWFDHLPYFSCRIRTGSVISQVRYWVGWSQSQTPSASDILQAGGNSVFGLGLRFSTNAGDAGWTMFRSEQSGIPAVAANMVMGASVPILASTLYVIEISVTSATSFTVTVNGVIVGVLSIPAPMLGNHTLHPIIVMDSLDAASKFLDFNQWYMERN